MSNRLAFVVLAAACMAAAAGGGYLATRQNTVPTPAAAAQVVPAAVPAATAPAAPGVAPAPDRPVQETEAVVGDAPKPAAPVTDDTKFAPRRAQPAPAARPAPSRTIAQNGQNGQNGSHREQPPTLTSSWPSSAQQPPAAPPASTPAPEPLPARVDDRAAQEPIRAPEPPKPSFEELVISRDSVIGLQTESRISSETARVEDRVEARVTRDVKVGDHVAVPSGAHVIGSVTQVERGGKYREQAKLGIRFHTIVLADGTRLPISTETILRLGEAPGNSSAAKIGGGAVGGAILGAILGGAKGAAIGATAGAGAGTAAVQAGDRNAVVLQPGTPLTARILAPVTVTVEKDQQ